MKNKVIIIGCIGAGSESLKFAQHSLSNSIVEVVNNIEAKNIINQINEPMIIKDYDRQIFTTTTKFEDLPRNKFIDKPRFNHKIK